MYKILEDNQDYLVINKAAGVVVHPGSGIEDKTLIEYLVAEYPKISQVGDDPDRPGIVHRLDKEVSGLMVIAKTNESFNDLKKQFQNREVKKHYLGLVYGHIEKESDTIDFPIKRAKGGHKMAAMPKTDSGHILNPRSRGNMIASLKSKEAITTFQVEKKFINYTLLDLNIKTGRTHQIRVHLFAYGHPLVGDPLYYTKKTKVKNDKLKLGRIFLVAKQLEFKNLQGELQSFSVELPEELKKFLEDLK